MCTVIQNFGRNVSFAPEVFVAPQTEAEVLQLLAQHQGKQIRVIGRLHAWSEAARGDVVVLDLRHLNNVVMEPRSDGVWATVGAGCQIKKLLVELERQAGVTMPSLGLISEQAIAGAISTGTHGSGKNSLSHYISEVRVATYDPATGEPIIRTISDGAELQAARCSLGCLGVILSVGLWCRPQYQVEEHFQRYDKLDDVLAAEVSFPLQQFFFVPWSWDFYVQHRREVSAPRSWLAILYRTYWFLVMDVGLHLFVMLFAKFWKSSSAIRFFFRRILPGAVVRNWRVVDKSQDMLIMEHELFRHIEIEVFVKRSQLAEALQFVTQLLRHFDGEGDAFSEANRQRLIVTELWDTLATNSERYTHSYPICVRKVLPDDTLMSMASSLDEPHYAISFANYARPNERQGFFQFGSSLTDTMARLFDARPHWGKWCPLNSQQAETLYPRLDEFRIICRRFDERGVFTNPWLARLLFSQQG